MSVADHHEAKATVDETGESGLDHSGSTYAVKLPVFEGPLDLLLHLIRQNEVEITEVSISQISEQYLQYLEIMQDLDLDVAAEYLVIAATLAHIKSRMLLPPSEEEDEDEGIDPREELIQRLLEYQRYKEVAEALGKRRLLGRDVFEPVGTGPETVPESEREIEVGIFELIEAFRQMLQDMPGSEEEQVHHVETEVVTVRDRMLSVMQAVKKGETVEFRQLFVMIDGGRPTRSVLVATFLAILELTRLQALSIYQGVDDEGSPDGAIRVRGVELAGEIAWDERITELM